ncbi:MAG: TetR/AcrR family transcriptional regulator [Muribaculaceae bacterium]
MLAKEKDNLSREIKILNAAEEEFMAHGYDGAKTTVIATKAGVTHAMLHYYYRTKENLFNKVFEEKIDLMAQSIFLSFQNSHLHLIDRIKAGIEAHFDFLSANPDLPRFVVNELISKPERRRIMEDKIGNIVSNIFIQLQQELNKYIDKGIIRPINVIDLLIDIASLNVFVFVSLPLLRSFAIAPYGNEKDFLIARKKENVEMIMSRLLIK